MLLCHRERLLPCKIAGLKTMNRLSILLVITILQMIVRLSAIRLKIVFMQFMGIMGQVRPLMPWNSLIIL